MKLINENEVEEKSLPGRALRWVVSGDTGLDAEFCSCCIMRVQPGQTVKPAHSHPDSEEFIYVMDGKGRVFVDGIIKNLNTGTGVLFEKGSIHMVQNNGDKEMKVACFYAPKTVLGDYKFHPEVDFESGKVVD